MADAGHNIGTGLDALRARVEQFAENVKRWTRETITAETAPVVKALADDGRKLFKEIEVTRREAMKPHEDLAEAENQKHKPLAAVVKTAGEGLGALLTQFALAQEARQKAKAAEARRIAEEEAKRSAEAAAAAKAAEETGDAFDKFDADEAAQAAEVQAQVAATTAAKMPERVNIASAEGGRAAALKVTGYEVTVDDAAALVAHFAAHPDVIDAARKAAAAQARAIKGATPIPGVTITPIRKAA